MLCRTPAQDSRIALLRKVVQSNAEGTSMMSHAQNNSLKEEGMPSEEQIGPKISLKYWVWLAGTAITTIGSQVIGFGLVWLALAESAWLASTILIIEVAPRVVLALVGGTLSDRFGPRKVMLSSAGAMTLGLVILGVSMSTFGVSPALLILAGLLVGSVDAFYVPASGSVPKYLVSDEHLPRAMAARQLVAQASVLFGPALGGIVIGFFGIVPSLFAGAGCYFAMLIVMALIKMPLPPKNEGLRGSIFGDARTGMRVVLSNVVTRQLLVLTGVFAAVIIPLASFFVPMIVRSMDLGAEASGMLVSSYSVGMLVVTMMVLSAGRAARPGIISCVGVILSSISLVLFGVGVELWVAAVLCCLAGVGAGLFATHMGPLFVSSIPVQSIGVSQAVMMLAQSLPLIVSNFLIAASESTLGVYATAAIWGVFGITIGLFALAHKEIRSASLSQTQTN